MNPGSTIDKYQIIKSLGSGNFGDVYLAFDRALACNKAIKILQISDPTAIAKLLKEAQILDKCRHKNIVSINGANIYPLTSNSILVLDLEYLPEGSLENQMSVRWISIKECCMRISAVLAGLDFAHMLGFLHRDIKPGNILIEKDSTKLSDFGLATFSSGILSSTQGYRPHCPPEFFISGQSSKLTDIYAVGSTLFRLINNYSDWRSRLQAMPKLKEKLENGKLINEIGFELFVPARIIKIIRKACNIDPSKRYQSSIEFKHDIDALRFDIEWGRISIETWSGFNGNDKFELNLISKSNAFDVEYKKNGRRVTAYCSTHKTLDAARNQIRTQIAQSSLK